MKSQVSILPKKMTLKKVEGGGGHINNILGGQTTFKQCFSHCFSNYNYFN